MCRALEQLQSFSFEPPCFPAGCWSMVRVRCRTVDLLHTVCFPSLWSCGQKQLLTALTLGLCYQYQRYSLLTGDRSWTFITFLSSSLPDSPNMPRDGSGYNQICTSGATNLQQIVTCPIQSMHVCIHGFYTSFSFYTSVCLARGITTP